MRILSITDRDESKEIEAEIKAVNDPETAQEAIRELIAA
jgi:hypothetical protein